MGFPQCRLVVTDVSVQPMVQSSRVFLNSFTFEDDADGLYRNFGNYHYMLRNIPEEPRFYLHLGRSLKYK